MAVVFTWIGALGTTVATIMLVLAAVVLAAGQGRRSARILCALLVFDATIVLCGTGLMYLTDDPRTTYAWQMTLFVVAPGPVLALYPLLWSTLPTPLGRPFRGPWYLAWSVLLVTACTVYPLVKPEDFVREVVPGEHSPWDAVLAGAAVPEYLALILTSLAGLVVAIDAWRRSRAKSLDRRKNGLYAAAFMVRDLTYVTIMVMTGLVASGRVGPGGAFWFLVVVPAAGTLVYAVVLAYGLLTAHLFDIDIKLKWTLSRGTVAATFLLAFLVVSQLIERVASERLGYVSGALAAGVMLFAINPLQRSADQLADRAMPKTEATPAYVTFRKMEVYKVAVEEVLADGTVSDKDRRVLDRLRSQLGLTLAEAASMERGLASPQGTT